jgi:hypothetical protein
MEPVAEDLAIPTVPALQGVVTPTPAGRTDAQS